MVHFDKTGYRTIQKNLFQTGFHILGYKTRVFVVKNWYSYYTQVFTFKNRIPGFSKNRSPIPSLHVSQKQDALTHFVGVPEQKS